MNWKGVTFNSLFRRSFLAWFLCRRLVFLLLPFGSVIRFHFLHPGSRHCRRFLARFLCGRFFFLLVLLPFSPLIRFHFLHHSSGLFGRVFGRFLGGGSLLIVITSLNSLFSTCLFRRSFPLCLVFVVCSGSRFTFLDRFCWRRILEFFFSIIIFIFLFSLLLFRSLLLLRRRLFRFRSVLIDYHQSTLDSRMGRVLDPRSIASLTTF